MVNLFTWKKWCSLIQHFSFSLELMFLLSQHKKGEQGEHHKGDKLEHKRQPWTKDDQDWKKRMMKRQLVNLLTWKKTTFIVDCCRYFGSSCLSFHNTKKKKKGPRGISQMMSLNTRCPWLTKQKKTFCNVFAHLKKMMKKVTSQALLLLKTMGVFIWVHDTLELTSLWNLQQAMAMVDIAQHTTYTHENLQRIKVS